MVDIQGIPNKIYTFQAQYVIYTDQLGKDLSFASFLKVTKMQEKYFWFLDYVLPVRNDDFSFLYPIGKDQAILLIATTNVTNQLLDYIKINHPPLTGLFNEYKYRSVHLATLLAEHPTFGDFVYARYFMTRLKIFFIDYNEFSLLNYV